MVLHVHVYFKNEIVYGDVKSIRQESVHVNNFFPQKPHDI